MSRSILILFLSISLLEVLGLSESIAANEVPQCSFPIPIANDVCTTPFECDIGEFCCPNEDTTCVPERRCYCDEESNVVVCYDMDLPIVCPSLCPLTRPDTNDFCSLESRFQCNYGNPIHCKNMNMTFDFEQQCTCYNNTFSCIDNVCPVTCPKIQPKNGAKCSPFASGNCDYGQLCCPGEEGNCVPETTCFCDDQSVYCSEALNSIPCPSICPKSPPNDMDSCDIDSRFECKYGDSLLCNDVEGGLSYDSEKTCTCIDGKFTCANNACPITCPKIQPNQGASCSPFQDYYCSYGEFCCPSSDAYNCIPRKVCSCDNDLKVSCYEPSMMCPSLCPDVKPRPGQVCNIQSRITCNYDEEDCPTECSCLNGVFACEEFCSEGTNTPVAGPHSPVVPFPSPTISTGSEWNDPVCPKYLSKDNEQCLFAEEIYCTYNEGSCPFLVCECIQETFICGKFCDGSSAPISIEDDDVNGDKSETVDQVKPTISDKKGKKKGKRKKKTGKGKKELKEKSGKLKKKKKYMGQ